MTQPSLDLQPSQGSPYEHHREDARRMNNKQRVLARLQEGPATTVQLMAVGGTRAPGRVHELRQDGWQIDVEDKKRGLFVYTLTGRKA